MILSSAMFDDAAQMKESQTHSNGQDGGSPRGQQEAPVQVPPGRLRNMGMNHGIWRGKEVEVLVDLMRSDTLMNVQPSCTTRRRWSGSWGMAEMLTNKRRTRRSRRYGGSITAYIIHHAINQHLVHHRRATINHPRLCAIARPHHKG
jgi:hypothetical protein